MEFAITMRGLTKKLAKPVKRALPITPDIMLDMLSFLNLNKRSDLVFWAILVISFFAMLRKSNLIPDTKTGFDPLKQLTWGHIEFRQGIAVITVTWAKNLQNQERLVEIPLFPILHSLLCPVTVLKALLNQSGRAHHPLFGSSKKAIVRLYA